MLQQLRLLRETLITYFNPQGFATPPPCNLSLTNLKRGFYAPKYCILCYISCLRCDNLSGPMKVKINYLFISLKSKYFYHGRANKIEYWHLLYFFMITGDPGRDARKNEETWTEPNKPLAGEAAVHLQHGQHHWPLRPARGRRQGQSHLHVGSQTGTTDRSLKMS